MKNLQRGFAPLIILLIVVVVLVAGGGIYVATKSKSNQPTQEPTPSQTNNPTPEPPIVTNAPTANSNQISSSDPKKAYLEMRADFDKAKTFADFVALTIKYGSKANIDKLNAQKAQVDALPAEFKESIVTQMKSLMPSSSKITTIKVVTSGDNTTLKVSSVDPQKFGVGTVIMVRENGAWKFDGETWKSSR